MTAGSIRLVAAALALVPLFGARAEVSQAPPAQSDPLLESVRMNLARSDREQYRYAYRERRSDVHTNPFGRLGTDGTLLYEVTPGDEYGIYHRLLIERDGKAVANEKRETVDRRGRSHTNPAVEDVVTTLSFQVTGREREGGRELVVVHFTPRKDAKPKTRQGKMAKAFKGIVWIDEQAREVVRLDATAVDDLSYGMGLLARLNEGTRVTLVREPVDGSVWLPTSIRMSGQGRAILIRRLKVDFFIEWFNYRRVQPAS
jgi:hypothetical protein